MPMVTRGYLQNCGVGFVFMLGNLITTYESRFGNLNHVCIAAMVTGVIYSGAFTWNAHYLYKAVPPANPDRTAEQPSEGVWGWFGRKVEHALPVLRPAPTQQRDLIYHPSLLGESVIQIIIIILSLIINKAVASNKTAADLAILLGGLFSYAFNLFLPYRILHNQKSISKQFGFYDALICPKAPTTAEETEEYKFLRANSSLNWSYRMVIVSSLITMTAMGITWPRSEVTAHILSFLNLAVCIVGIGWPALNALVYAVNADAKAAQPMFGGGK